MHAETNPWERRYLSEQSWEPIHSRRKPGVRDVPRATHNWVSEGRLTRSHRPQPTLRAGQGPMLTSISQEVAEGDRQLRRVWLRE